MKKKLASLLVCIMMTVLILTGCNTDNGTASTDVTGQPDSGTEDLGINNPVEEIELVLWNEFDFFYDHAYKKAIADFEDENPGVTIIYETYEFVSYRDHLNRGSDRPDIFRDSGGRFSKPEKSMALDAYFTDEYKTQISEAVLSGAKHEGMLYGVPYNISVPVLLYDKAIFEENRVEPPSTFDELIDVCKTLIENGVTPFCISAKDALTLAMIHEYLTLRSAGHEKVVSALNGGGQRYNAPEFIEAAAKFQQLVKMGVFIDGAIEISYDDALSKFYEGRTAMIVALDYVVDYIETKDLEDLGVVSFPAVGNNSGLSDFLGSASYTLNVSQSTEHPELAAKAAFELARSISKYSYIEGVGQANIKEFPAWKVDYDDSSVNPLKRKLVSLATNMTSLTDWFECYMKDEQKKEEYFELLQQLYLCQLSPEEFAEAMGQQLNLGDSKK